MRALIWRQAAPKQPQQRPDQVLARLKGIDEAGRGWQDEQGDQQHGQRPASAIRESPVTHRAREAMPIGSALPHQITVRGSLQNCLACQRGTDILLMFHGRDAHATRRYARSSDFMAL